MKLLRYREWYDQMLSEDAEFLRVPFNTKWEWFKTAAALEISKMKEE